MSKYENPVEDNNLLRKASGEIDINSKLVAFLYQLMRDHLPIGDVEKLVRDNQVEDCYYTNGWLAQYAKYLADRLK